MFRLSPPVQFMLLSLFTAVLVVTVGLLAFFLDGTLFSNAVYQLANRMDANFFLHMIDQEIPGGDFAGLEEKRISPFEILLGVKISDPLTFIRSEIPGLKSYKGEMVAEAKNNDPNDQTDNSVISPESWAKMKVDSIIPDEVPVIKQLPKQNPTVFIYHTHNRESWLPELKNVKDSNEAYDVKTNITLVGNHFAEKLKDAGIPVLVDETDHTGILMERGLLYPLSYAISLETVKEAFRQNPEIDYVFDFHRDYQSRDKTTVTIDGVDYAKIMFVVGKHNKKWEKNLAFANRLQQILEEKYPGICRPIAGYEKSSGHNGEYNQSVSPHALTVEIGGVENTLEETKRTVELLADAFAEVYFDAVPVFQQGGKIEQ